jgi:hypothetical protein
MTEEAVAQLRGALAGAGMAPGAIDQCLARSHTTTLARSGAAARLLAVWGVLLDALGPQAANTCVARLGAFKLFNFSPDALAAKLAALRQELALQQGDLERMLTRFPPALGVAAGDLGPRLERWAALLGLGGRREAAAWLARHPQMLARPMLDPERHLAQLQRVLGVDRAAVQRHLRSHHFLVSSTTATLEAAMQLLPPLLGVSGEAFRAAVAASPSALTVPLRTAHRRHAALQAAAERSPAWAGQWEGMSIGSKCLVLRSVEGSHARLDAVLAAGLDGHFSMLSVLSCSEEAFARRLARAVERRAARGGGGRAGGRAGGARRTRGPAGVGVAAAAAASDEGAATM